MRRDQGAVPKRRFVLGEAFPALAEPRMRGYFLGQLLSILGSWILDITLNLLVWRLTQSALMVGLLNFLIYAPSLVVTPLLSSRLHVRNARRISLSVLAAALLVALSLSAMARSGLVSLPVLLGMALLRGLLGGMEVPSRQMLLMNLSQDAAQLSSAIALNTVVFLVARTVGPALAAFLFETAGAAWGFALAAAATAAMLRCVAGLPDAVPPHQAQAEPESGSDAREGGVLLALRFVRADGFGRLFFPITASVAFCTGASQTLIPVLAAKSFGSASVWTGWFYAASGLGALVVAVLLSSRHMQLCVRHGLMAAPWLTGVALLVLALSSHPALTLCGFLLLGGCTSFVGTGTNASLHRRIPPALRGGLIGLLLLAFSGTMPFAQLVAGALAQWASPRAAFGCVALAFLLVVSLCFGRRWRELGQIVWNAERL